MDNTKHNQPAAAQESDDLIAELARLVAQDARNTSSQSDAYRDQEPSAAPEPVAAEPLQNDFYESESSFGVPEQFEPLEPQSEAEAPAELATEGTDAMPGFDFTDSAELSPEAADPIAGLIADAEVEAYDRDFAQEVDWAEGNAEAFEPIAPTRPDTAHDYGRIDDFSAAPGRGERDPLSEIEALIGEAARVNVGADGGMSGRRVRSSYLQDDATGDAADAAESAILAAAAATGAPLRRAEPSAVHESQIGQQEAPRTERAENPEVPVAPQHHPDPLFAAGSVSGSAAPISSDDAPVFEDDGGEFSAARPRRRIGGFVLPVAAGALIVALIGGAYFMFFSGPPAPGEVPVLTANAGPLKEEPDATQVATAASESVVFNEIEGNTTAPEDEALVSRDQTEGASVAEVLAPEEGALELVNRSVRTVTVLPDGTIVQAEDGVAGSNVLPVERPDVPVVPNSTLTSDPIGQAIVQAMAAEESAPTEGVEQLASLDGTTSLAADEASEGVEAATAAADVLTAPQPIPRPEGLTASGGNAATDVPNLAVVPTTPVAAATPSTPSQTQPAASEPAAWVQLASQRSEDVAQAGMTELQARYGTLFGAAELEVSRVDLGDRGIYYRVRLPQPSLADANAVCGAIQGQGGDCFVMNN